MTRHLPFLLLALFLFGMADCGLRISAQTLVWNPPATPVNGYMLVHGTQSGAYSDFWSVGTATNYTITTGLPSGANYFVVMDFQFNDGTLYFSAWSNEIILTNTPELLLETVTLTTTNLGGSWLPYQTNQTLLLPTMNAQFFKAGRLALSKTNVITGPPL